MGQLWRSQTCDPGQRETPSNGKNVIGEQAMLEFLNYPRQGKKRCTNVFNAFNFLQRLARNLYFTSY